MSKISVVLPSRLARREVGSDSRLLLEDAISSIRRQQLEHAIEIVVGVDAGCHPSSQLVEKLGVHFVAGGNSQAAAFNAAARHANGDFLAFLEDDDLWLPTFLQEALRALQGADFVSSTQLEVSQQGSVLRINDFPTPSGWVMKRATWESVGFFNEAYRYHLDNEWLGRLSLQDIRRVHLVEATAPVDPTLAEQVRPWLVDLLHLSGGRVSLLRHDNPYPLVIRTVHSGSGMYKIQSDPEAHARSLHEIALLRETFSRVPW